MYILYRSGFQIPLILMNGLMSLNNKLCLIFITDEEAQNFLKKKLYIDKVYPLTPDAY